MISPALTVASVVNARCSDAPDPFERPYDWSVSTNTSALNNSSVHPGPVSLLSNSTNVVAES